MELFVFKKYFSCFVDVGEKNIFFKLKPDVTSIILHGQKVTLSLFIPTTAWFSKNYTLWSYDYDTFQPKIGQCDDVR